MEEKALIIEMLLAEAIEKISQVPPIVKTLKELDSKTNGMHIGRAICELGEVRKDLYKSWPNLTSDFEKDINIDFEKYKNLSSEYIKAYECEQAGMLEEAEKLFKSLRENQESMHFKTLAEAALFRINETQKHNKENQHGQK